MPHKTKKRRSPGSKARATSTTPIAAPNSNGTAADLTIDKVVVASVDQSIWRALFDGHFRLAVVGDSCGRWLISSESKRARRGPVCRAKAGRHD